MDFIDAYLESVKIEFGKTKALGLKSIQALSDAELNRDFNEANSIATIVKHLHGNMKSRWTNLFTEDGEKPDRDRDGEFAGGTMAKGEVERLYAEGWGYLEKALADLREADFAKPVIIRKESLPLMVAVNRQVSHYAYHVGQIVLLAKQSKGDSWTSLSIPKGKSKDFDQGTYAKP